jgi:hypothetical protein
MGTENPEKPIELEAFVPPPLHAAFHDRVGMAAASPTPYERKFQ